MAKQIDLGYMSPAIEETTTTKQKRTKQYPTVWVDRVDLPFTAADVGKDFEVNAKIHITGIEERTDEKPNRKRKEYKFELRSMVINDTRTNLKGALKKAGKTLS